VRQGRGKIAENEGKRIRPSHAASSPVRQAAVQVTPDDGAQADVDGFEKDRPSGLSSAVEIPPIPADLTVEGRSSDPMPEEDGMKGGYSAATKTRTTIISDSIHLRS